MSSRTIIPISKKDLEVFRAATFSKKALSREKREKLKDKLADYYDNKPDSVDAALSYAAFHIMPDEEDSPFEKKDSIEEAVEAFQRVQELNPGHWLSWYYALKLQSLFTEYYGDEEELINEARELIEMQNTAPEHKTYYVLTHVLLAKLLYHTGKKEEALQFIEKAEQFEARPIAELPDFLGYLFNEFENKLRDIDENDMADRVKKMSDVYFPDY